MIHPSHSEGYMHVISCNILTVSSTAQLTANVLTAVWAILVTIGVRARRSLECNLTGRWEPGILPSRNRECTHCRLFEACHSSWHIKTDSWQIRVDVTAKTVYSDTISDDEELLGSCAVLRELYVRGYQVYPGSVDRNNFVEYHYLCKKVKKFSKSICPIFNNGDWNRVRINKIF